MRVLFGLDATDFNDTESLETYMASSGITFVRRVGFYWGTFETLWIISRLHWRRVKSFCLSDRAVHWQEITACNKQYVTQYGSDGSHAYLGCVHAVTQDEALGLDQYILDPFTGEFWVFREGNPNKFIVPQPEVVNAVDTVDHGLREIMQATPWPVDPAAPLPEGVVQISMDEIVTGGLAEAMDTAVRWPVDKAAPKFDERAHHNPANWPMTPERG